MLPLLTLLLLGAQAADTDQLIEQRRAKLKELGTWFSTPPQPLKGDDVKVALAQLAAAIGHRDARVYEAAASDLSNGAYRPFPDDALLDALRPALKEAEREQQRMRAQGLVIEHVRTRFGPKARVVLPDLLRMVRDDRGPTYLRGQSIQAAAVIGPGDEAVVTTFIEALENPNPKNESGVHDRVIEALGDMGKAALPAKRTLEKMLTHRWYGDGAYIALGKLAMDDPPRPLAEYLARLRKLDTLPPDQAAAAFLHVQKLCNPPAPVRPPNADIPPSHAKLDRRLAAEARPVLLRLIEPGSDSLPTRAALRTLEAIGPGSSPEMIAALVRPIGAKPSAANSALRGDAVRALNQIEPTDPAAVPVLVRALEAALAGGDWFDRERLARAIAKYGKDARPAGPVLVKALDGFKARPGPFAYEELAAYADALAVIGPDVPGARATVLHLLDLDRPLMKKADPANRQARAKLLVTLSRLGLPDAGEEREALLDRVRAGLSDSSAPMFSAAAGVVAAHGAKLTEKEAAQLLPLLMRPLAKGFKFQPGDQPELIALQSRPEDGRPPVGLGTALRALGALGPAAREALPELQAIADEKVIDTRGTFRTPPARNNVILEARKAVQRIQGN